MHCQGSYISPIDTTAEWSEPCSHPPDGIALRFGNSLRLCERCAAELALELEWFPASAKAAKLLITACAPDPDLRLEECD